MKLTMTARAVEKSREIRSKLSHPDDWVLRIGLSGGGCSGFSYKIDFMAPDPDDKSYRAFTYDGLNLYCDRKSYIFLVGTEIDYEETIMSSGFTFNSPLAKSKCGCGESVGF